MVEYQRVQRVWLGCLLLLFGAGRCRSNKLSIPLGQHLKSLRRKHTAGGCRGSARDRRWDVRSVHSFLYRMNLAVYILQSCICSYIYRNAYVGPRVSKKQDRTIPSKNERPPPSQRFCCSRIMASEETVNGAALGMRHCRILYSTQSGRAKACARRAARILGSAASKSFDDDLRDHGGGLLPYVQQEWTHSSTLLLFFVSTTGDGAHTVRCCCNVCVSFLFSNSLIFC